MAGWYHIRFVLDSSLSVSILLQQPCCASVLVLSADRQCETTIASAGNRARFTLMATVFSTIGPLMKGTPDPGDEHAPLIVQWITASVDSHTTPNGYRAGGSA